MLKADFVPDSWDGEEPEFTTTSDISMSLVRHMRACSDTDPLDLPKVVEATKDRMIPKKQVQILIQKYPNLIREIRKSEQSPSHFIEMFIFNMEGYLKPIPSNALKDAKKKQIDLYNTYSVLFSKRLGGLDGYLESPNKIDDQTLRPLYEAREEVWIIEQRIYWRDYVKDLIGLTTNIARDDKRAIMDDLNFLMKNSKFLIKKKKIVKPI